MADEKTIQNGPRRSGNGGDRNDRETGARKFELDYRETHAEFDQAAAENQPKKPYGVA